MKTNKTPASDPGRDRKRVASQQDWEVSYIAEKFGVENKAVEEAIRQVGNSRTKVEAFLNKNQKRK